MNTIEAYEKDISLQVGFLQKIKLQKPLSQQRLDKTVFCGTGDSLASAMLAESFSNFRVKALDPLDIIKNKKLVQGKFAYFVSVSGNTISNIRAAKLANNSTAITKNRISPLAKSCNQPIQLRYQDSHVLTSGSIGFLASMLMCVSLVFDFRIKSAKKLFMEAQSQACKILLKNKIYVIGNQHTYPLAMYASAKLYEVLGSDAHYERIEQFSHASLFSAKKGDTVIIFEKTNRHNKQLVAQLKKLGLSVYNPSIMTADKISQVIFYTFVSQLMTLYDAKRKQLDDCHFIIEKKFRNASSTMIY
ncbi:MAG TPA: SIS domain-containing protein [Candidatus Nitrosotenuis sp.]|jgi:fructoselysine-6-P-deglycase FrlB-like protein